MEDFLQSLFDQLEEESEDKVRWILQESERDLVAAVQGLWTSLIASLWERYRGKCLARLDEQGVSDAVALFDPVQAEINSVGFAYATRKDANDRSMDIVARAVSLQDVDVATFLGDAGQGLAALATKLVEQLMEIPVIWWAATGHVSQVGKAITKEVKKSVFNKSSEAQAPELAAAALEVVGQCDEAKAIARKMTKEGSAPDKRDLTYALPTFFPDPVVLPAKQDEGQDRPELGRRLAVNKVLVVPNNPFAGEEWAKHVATLSLPSVDEATGETSVGLDIYDGELSAIDQYGVLLGLEPGSTLDLVVTTAMPGMQHSPLKLSDTLDDQLRVRSLQVLLADAPTAKQVAHSFFANPDDPKPDNRT